VYEILSALTDDGLEPGALDESLSILLDIIVPDIFGMCTCFQEPKYYRSENDAFGPAKGGKEVFSQRMCILINRLNNVLSV
jgi:hypothetical protein